MRRRGRYRDTPGLAYAEHRVKQWHTDVLKAVSIAELSSGDRAGSRSLSARKDDEADAAEVLIDARFRPYADAGRYHAIQHAALHRSIRNADTIDTSGMTRIRWRFAATAKASSRVRSARSQDELAALAAGLCGMVAWRLRITGQSCCSQKIDAMWAAVIDWHYMHLPDVQKEPCRADWRGLSVVLFMSPSIFSMRYRFSQQRHGFIAASDALPARGSYRRKAEAVQVGDQVLKRFAKLSGDEEGHGRTSGSREARLSFDCQA